MEYIIKNEGIYKGDFKMSKEKKKKENNKETTTETTELTKHRFILSF